MNVPVLRVIKVRLKIRVRGFCFFCILGEGFSGFEKYVVGLWYNFALLNRLCSLLFCWQISAGGCVLI